jgi:hypothetical protein
LTMINGREKMSQQQHYDQVMMEQHQQELQQQERKMNYNELRKINVSDHIEKKNGLSYLSWAWAVDTLLQQDPTASWGYGEPKQFGETLMVFCTVHAFGKSMTAQLPVLNFRNQAIPNPDAMAVNTAMQRWMLLPRLKQAYLHLVKTTLSNLYQNVLQARKAIVLLIRLC